MNNILKEVLDIKNSKEEMTNLPVPKETTHHLSQIRKASKVSEKRVRKNPQRFGNTELPWKTKQ